MPRRLPNPWVRAVVGGAAVVALSYLMGVERYNGAGMGVITAAIEQGHALPWDFLCKMLLTALTLSAGFKGGEVVPSFYIGARSSAARPIPSSPLSCWPMSCSAGRASS